MLTVSDHKEVYAKDCETFPDIVVCILKLPLHHGSIDLDHDDAAQASEDHLASSPLIRQPLRGDGVRHESNRAVDASKSQDRL